VFSVFYVKFCWIKCKIFRINIHLNDVREKKRKKNAKTLWIIQTTQDFEISRKRQIIRFCPITFQIFSTYLSNLMTVCSVTWTKFKVTYILSLSINVGKITKTVFHSNSSMTQWQLHGYLNGWPRFNLPYFLKNRTRMIHTSNKMLKHKFFENCYHCSAADENTSMMS